VNVRLQENSRILSYSVLSLKELERDLKGMKKENLPKIRRFSAKRMRMQSLEIIKSPKRLSNICALNPDDFYFF
jgi:hypothetical protein